MEIKLDAVFGYEWAINRTKLSYSENVAEGDIDYELAKKLARSGPSHSKFLRCMSVYLTINAPRYWWQQYATYKVATVELSGSTMHLIMKRPLTQEDFERPINGYHLAFLNDRIACKDFDSIKNNLPEGYLQTRGCFLNYQVLRTIYQQRRHHKLPEWQVFCDFVESMPMSELIVGE